MSSYLKFEFFEYFQIQVKLFLFPLALNSITIWATVCIDMYCYQLTCPVELYATGKKLNYLSNSIPGQIIFRFLQAENSITVWATVCIDTVVNLLVLLNYMPHHTGWSIRAAAIAPHFILYLFCENVDGFLFKFWYHKLSTLFVQIITVVIR